MAEILPNHDVSIGTTGFFASNCKADYPFPYQNYDKVEIQSGMPRFYQTNITPRHMTFTATLNGSDRVKMQDDLKNLQGMQDFVSIWIGSFTALVKITDFVWADGFVNTLTVSFDITEIE